jgi:hypothetical protein
MTDADEIANDAAQSDSPLRSLLLGATADMIEMAMTLAPAKNIHEHLEAIILAAEKRMTVDTVMASGGLAENHMTWGHA